MLRSYDKSGDISYSLGAFPTVELIRHRPSDIESVVLRSDLRMTDELEEILAPVRDKTVTDDKSVSRVAKKGNVYMVGVFRKRYTPFGLCDHVALVRPSDEGNLGAIFSLDVCEYPDWATYAAEHGENKMLFMLDKRSITLGSAHVPHPRALVFGNEGSGLPPELAEEGTPVIVRHSRDIDSLNLPQAVAIGLYETTKHIFCGETYHE
mgnify:CR=1 FL=1